MYMHWIYLEGYNKLRRSGNKTFQCISFYTIYIITDSKGFTKAVNGENATTEHAALVLTRYQTPGAEAGGITMLTIFLAEN